MLSTVDFQLQQVKEIRVSPANERVIRDSAADVLSVIHRQAAGVQDADELLRLKSANRDCLRVLKQLQNVLLFHRTAADMTFQTVEFSQFAYDLFSAVDLCLCSSGRRLEYRGQEGVTAVCDFDALQTAFYTLITLLVRDTRPKERLRVTMWADRGSIRLEFSAPCYQGAFSSQWGSVPLLSAMNTAALHEGILLFHQSPPEHQNQPEQRVRMTLSRKLKQKEGITPRKPPDFVELFCDRLSPLYVGLAEICDTPL